MSSSSGLLELTGIEKHFGPVVANASVDLRVLPGEIHALVGENGAGKTTLMNILYGIVQPDAGSIRLDGEQVQFQRPQDAIDRGIGMVHQHFMLVPSLTVLENITLGAEPKRHGLYDRHAARERVREPLARLDMDLDLDAVTGSLSVAAQQRLEIVKVLYRGARIVILDEPTAVLTPQETAELFVLLRQLAAEGTAVIFISHKLREVFEIADRVTVLRDGRSITSLPAVETDAASIVAAMTGSTSVNLGRVQRPTPQTHARPVLTVEGLTTERPSHDAAVDCVSFSVWPGEIVGIAGVEGNGQSALAESLIGALPATSGRVQVGDADLSGAPVAVRRDAGISYVPEDRQREGLPLHGTVIEGLVAGRIRERGPGRGLATAMPRSLRAWGREQVRRYRIRTSSIDSGCATLSGGNQQKVVVARELEDGPRVLILAQPTRGVDLGAIDFLYSRIAEETAAGCAIVLVSADLDEILRLSDRVLVMYGGRIVAERLALATSREELGRYMTGAGEDTEAA